MDVPGISPNALRTHPRGLRSWSLPARRALGRLLEDEVRDPLWRKEAGTSWGLPPDTVAPEPNPANNRIDPPVPAQAADDEVTNPPGPEAPDMLVTDNSDDEDDVLIRQAAPYMVRIHHSISPSPEPDSDSDTLIIWLSPCPSAPSTRPSIPVLDPLAIEDQPPEPPSPPSSPNNGPLAALPARPMSPPPGSYSPSTHPWVPLWESQPERFPRELGFLRTGLSDEARNWACDWARRCVSRPQRHNLPASSRQ